MYLYLVQRSILSTSGDKILRKRTLILWWNTFVLKGIDKVQNKKTICQGSCPKFNNSISVMFKWGFSRNSALVTIPLAFRLCLSCCSDCHLVELKWDVVVAGGGLPVAVIQNNRYSRNWKYSVQLMESLWLCSLLLSCCHRFKYDTQDIFSIVDIV